MTNIGAKLPPQRRRKQEVNPHSGYSYLYQMMGDETHEMQINGVVSIPRSVSQDEFEDKFIQFIEANGWSFGGSTGPYQEEKDEDQPVS